RGDVRVSGSLDGFGVRSASFNLRGSTLSPERRALLRGMPACKITGIRGVGPDLAETVELEGYVRDCSFDAVTLDATVSAQDSSILHADKLLTYELARGAGKTRKTILEEICTAHDIPVGTWQLPGGDGGYGYKSISHGGDVGVFAWLVEYLLPLGCRPFWRDNALHIAPFDASGDASRLLTGGEMRRLSIDPAPGNGTNAVQCSAGIFQYIGAEGEEVTEATVDVAGPYTPAVAVQKQDRVWGTVADVTPASAAEDLERRTITREYKRNGTLWKREVEVYGWHAARVSHRQIVFDALGILPTFTTHNTQLDCWKYGDGTWRLTEREQWGLIRREVTLVRFNADGEEIHSDTYVSGAVQYPAPVAGADPTTGAADYWSLYGDREEWIPHPGSIPTWWGDYVDINGEEYLWLPEYIYDQGPPFRNSRYRCVFVDADGSAWVGRGFVLSTSEAGSIYWAIEGGIAETWGTELVREVPSWSGATKSGIAATIDAQARSYEDAGAVVFPDPRALYIFGPNGPAYAEIGAAAFAGGWDETLTDIDGLSYTRVVAHDSTGVTGTITLSNCIATLPPEGSTTVGDPLPERTSLVINGDPQPATVKVVDSMRQALAHGREYLETFDNDFCETDAEIATAAKELLRNAAHTIVGTEIPVDFSVVEGTVLELEEPSAIAGTAKVVAWSLEHRVNGKTGENGTSITARRYHGELG
ncbi:MAG: hypothetical protein WA208_21110, partial [Thermoanaerobaculia bacterium]